MIRKEIEHSIAGVAGRMSLIERKDGLWGVQEWTSKMREGKYGDKIRLRASVRFDDSCRNGHNSFCVTGSYDIWDRGRWAEGGGGRCDKLIAKIFPELAHLQKWNLCSTEGPMHSAGNVTYLAGNRDHWGLLKGEPHPGEQHQDYRIYVGNSPVPHKLGRKFMRWVMARLEFMRSTPRSNPDSYDFSPVEVPYKQKPGEGRDYKSQWTMRGFDATWGGAPFDSLEQAEGWAKAFNVDRTNREYLRITTVPTLFGEGKERDLDAARSSAIWPEATDEQLCLPKEELKALLDARLPALLASMKKDLTEAGLFWAPADYKEQA